jgi:hypothetical protein
MENRSVDRLIEDIASGFAALAEVDLPRLTGVEVLELVQSTQRLRSLADAAGVRSAGALDVSKAWAPEGAKSPAAWMQWRCGIQRARAMTFLRCARELRDMPATETALLAGEITTDHVRLLVDAKQLSPEAFALDEDRLVRAATTYRVAHVEKLLAYWKQVNEPDRTEDEAESTFQERRAHASRSIRDLVMIDAMLDPVGGEIFLRELERREQELWEADWAEARERLGDAACEADLWRTRQQRRADAMRIMAERSAAKPADATEARVLLHVLVGEESLERICELSNGRVVTPGQLAPHLDKADVERIVFDGPSKVIDVGVRQRLFRGATRTAVLVRDRGCIHPSCDVPMDRCEVDHVIPWADGGETTQRNGAATCGFHNRLKGRTPPPAA